MVNRNRNVIVVTGTLGIGVIVTFLIVYECYCLRIDTATVEAQGGSVGNGWYLDYYTISGPTRCGIVREVVIAILFHSGCTVSSFDSRVNGVKIDGTMHSLRYNSIYVYENGSLTRKPTCAEWLTELRII